jgi:hypothetical protein
MLWCAGRTASKAECSATLASGGGRNTRRPSSEDGGCSRAALMTDQAGRGFRSLTGRAFLTFLVALPSSSCTAGYSQCLHNGGGVLRCSVSSGQINQRARASALASCSAGDEDVCRKACAQTRDPQICDTWFATRGLRSSVQRSRLFASPRVISHMTGWPVAERAKLETKRRASIISK